MSAMLHKFLPRATPLSQPYWDACNRHQLLIQHCPDCSHYQFYPRSFCTACMRRQPEWVRASGQGTIETWTIVRRPVTEAYTGDTPYVIALVRLEEGPLMMSQVTDCDPERVKTGMPVKVVFRAWSDDVTMPLFAPGRISN